MLPRRALPLLAALAGACSSDPAPVDPPADAATLDAAVMPDAGEPVDAAADAPADRGADAPRADRPDAPVALDAGSDAGSDAGFDAGFDAGSDAGFDAGSRDTGSDAVDVPAPIDVGRDVGTPDVGTPDVGTPDAGTPDAGCVAPRRLCGAACVDPASDGANCGACGNRCATACSGGACVTVAQVSAGSDFTCARLADGSARCWGSNENGQIGDGRGGTRFAQTRPAVVTGLVGAVEVVAGSTHACARMADGTARCWGRNSSGQIGDGTAGDTATTPRAVVGLAGVAGFALGDNYSCARLTDGTVRCWGSNLSGQVGQGTQTGGVLTPTAVPGLTGVVAISAGVAHTCAALADGTVRCWGMNFQGQSGAGPAVQRALSPVTVAGITGAVGVAAGSFFTCAWRGDGAVRCWGDNSGYDLGDGTGVRQDAAVAVAGLDRVASVAAGASFACARRTDNAVLCWGTNALGQMGDGTIGGAQMVPTAVPGLGAAAEVSVRGDHACARLATGAVRCWGSDNMSEIGDDASFSGHRTPEVPLGVRAAAVGVEAGGDHTCARFADGTAQCWGGGSSGELGDGAAGRSRHAPVAVTGLTTIAQLAGGAFNTCARLTDGTLRCWGYNVDGEIGDGTEGGTRPSPTAVLGVTGAVDLGLGQTFVCALAGGAVRCWGNNRSGNLGLGYNDTFPHSRAANPVVGLTGAAGVGVGLSHSCAFTTAGLARCWGANEDGEIGDGTLVLRPASTAVAGLANVTAVTAGYRHSCALRGDGTVACWGGNNNGQVGDGTMVTPRPTALTVPGLAGVAQLTTGDFHNCARLTDGTVRCWGNNDFGQCGDDTQLVARLAPVAVRGLAGVAEISAGAYHTCARLTDGALRCWGRDHLGQLSLGALRAPRW